MVAGFWAGSVKRGAVKLHWEAVSDWETVADWRSMADWETVAGWKAMGNDQTGRRRQRRERQQSHLQLVG